MTSFRVSQSETSSRASQLNYAVGQTMNLSSVSGTVSFPQNKFTQPPIVIASVVRWSITASGNPINVCITEVTKDYFTYFTKFCYGGTYRQLPGDKLNWLAISR